VPEFKAIWHSALTRGAIRVSAMEVLQPHLVRAAEASTVVVCTALLLGRLVRRLWVGGGTRQCLRDCSVRLFAFSTAVKTFVLGGIRAHDSFHVHKRSMRADISRHFVWVFSRVTVCYLTLQILAGDNSQNILPFRLSSCLCCLVYVILTLLPGLVTPLFMHFWYSFLLLATALKISPLFQFAESIPDLRIFIMFDCIHLAVMNLCLPMNLLWASTLYLSAGLTVLIGRSNGSFCFDFVRTLEAILFDWVLVSVFVVSMHIVFSKAAAFHLESTHSKNELRAARAILAGICDAVVELDPNLKLAHKSEGLAALLMISPLRNKTGASILSILATDADREKFAEQVTSSTTYDKFCKAFHVNMRDTRGISVPVEIFCVRFTSSEDKESYLLGLREFWDRDSPSDAHQQELPNRELKACVRASSHSSFDERASIGTSSAESSEAPTIPRLAIWFDAQSPKFTMLRCTSGFEMLNGSAWAQICEVEPTLLGCTQPDQRDDLAYWIHQCVDDFTGSGSREEAVPMSVEMVRFRFSEHHHRFRLVIQSKVTLALAPTPGENWPADWPASLGQFGRPAKLVFERPEWIQGEGWSRLWRARAPVPAVAQGPVGDTFTPRLGGDGTRGLGSGGPDYRIAL